MLKFYISKIDLRSGIDSHVKLQICKCGGNPSATDLKNFLKETMGYIDYKKRSEMLKRASVMYTFYIEKYVYVPAADRH